MKFLICIRLKINNIKLKFKSKYEIWNIYRNDIFQFEM